MLLRRRAVLRASTALIASGVLLTSLSVVSSAVVRPRATFPPYPTALTSADLALAAKYVGGVAGTVAKGTTITVGFLNDDTGTPAYPEGSAGADVAVNLINKDLGGIKGHRLSLVQCDVSSASVAAACAATLVADHVKVVLTGAVDAQPDTAMYQTLATAGIPVIVGNSLTPTDFSPPAGTTASYMPGTPGLVLGMDKFIGTGGTGTKPTKVVAFYLQGDAGSQASFNLLKSSSFLTGVTIVGEAIAQPWSLAQVSVAVNNAKVTAPPSSVFTPLLPAQQCLEYAQAAAALAVHNTTVTTGQCYSSQLPATAGTAGWYFTDYGVNPYMYDKALPTSQQLGVYIASAAKYNAALDRAALFGAASFADVMTLAKLYDRAGSAATSAQLAVLVQNFTGPQWGISGPMTCGSVDTSFPTSCGKYVGVARLLSSGGKGVWAPVQDAYNAKLIDPYPAPVPTCVGQGSCTVTSSSPQIICLTVAGCPLGGTTVSTVTVGGFSNGKLAPNKSVTVHFLSPSVPSSSGSWCQGANGKTKTGHTDAHGVFKFNYTSAGPGGTPPIASFCIIRAVIGKSSIIAAIDQTNDPAPWTVSASPRKVSRVNIPSAKATLHLIVKNPTNYVFGDPTAIVNEIPSAVGGCGAVNPLVRKTTSPHGQATLVYTPSTIGGTRTHPVTCTLIGQEADTGVMSNRVVIHQNKR